MIAAALMMFACAGQAQTTGENSCFSNPSVYTKANIPAVLKAFETCLAMDNEGVQESAMAQLAMLKLMVPSVHAAAITERLERLALAANTPGTRFKAYITSQVYRNPEIFAKEKAAQYNDGDELFHALAARLQNSMLTYSGH
jgi:hypothetical protein